MGNKEKNLLKKAVEYYQHFSASHSDLFIFHDNRFMSDCLAATREFAKGEDIRQCRNTLSKFRAAFLVPWRIGLTVAPVVE